MNYNIDIEKFIKWYIPESRNRAFDVSWLKSLLAGNQQLNTDAVAFIDMATIEAKVTGQTIWLEKKLNDELDNALRRFSIIHATENNLFYYIDSEISTNRFQYTNAEVSTAVYNYADGESTSSLPVGIDFRVIVGFELGAVLNYQYTNSEVSTSVFQYTLAEGGVDTYYYINNELYDNQIIAIVDKYKVGGRKYDISQTI